MAAAEYAESLADPSPGDDPRAAKRARLRLVGDQVAPLALARERTLPVLPLLADLFPEGALRRGSVVGVHGPGATSLALAVAAGPSGSGSWTALVGDPALGLGAAAEAGVALERVLVVDPPDADAWATTMAALVGAVDVIVAGPGRRRAPATRRLSSRLRERGSVILAIGGSWSPGADVGLTVTDATWTGLGVGHGVLTARRVVVRAEGRGAAARPRRAELLLPGPDGAPALIEAIDGLPGEGRAEAIDGRWAGADIDRLVAADIARDEVVRRGA